MTVNKMALEAFESKLARTLGVQDGQYLSEGFYGYESKPMPDLVQHFKRHDRELRKLRERLLLDLANVSLDSRRLQKRMESFEPDPPEGLASVQQLLRVVWPRDVPLDKKQYLVNLLLVAATKRPGRAGLYAPLAFGHLELWERNFPGQLVIAMLENWWRMAKCGNPGCPAPYFLAKRSSQRYCERGDCTQYAVRQKALKWWRDNRSKPARKERSKR